MIVDVRISIRITKSDKKIGLFTLHNVPGYKFRTAIYTYQIDLSLTSHDVRLFLSIRLYLHNKVYHKREKLLIAKGFGTADMEELIYICCRFRNPPAAYISEFFFVRAFHGNRRYYLYYRELFYFLSTIAMNKRIITSKGDGINYLGCDPNGEYHNMREFEGGFFEIVYEIGKGVVPKGEILTKDQFILQK